MTCHRLVRVGRLAMQLVAVLVVTRLTAARAVAGLDPEAAPIPESERWAIRAGSADKVKALLADVGFMQDLDGGYVWSRIAIDRGTVRFSLQRRHELPDGAEVASLLLSPAQLAASTEGPNQSRSRSFAIEIKRPAARGSDPRIERALAAAIGSIVMHDDGSIYTNVGKPGFYSTRELLGISPIRPHAILLVFALLATLGLVLRGGNRYSARFKLTHVLPSLIQSALFAYWALYWPGLHPHFPLIALQLLFAFMVELALGLLVRRHAELGFGFVPITLSTNLFIQFPPEALYLSFLAIFTALAAKTFLRRGGRHIFNPSAIGIAVVGCVHLLLPRLGDGDVSDELNLAPNMGELMLALALIVQFRVPVVLISISAAGALLAFIHASGLPAFHPFWAPVLLVLLLVATDPATSPRTGLGRVFYGLALGLLMATGASLLEANGRSDFYAKMIPVPIVNLLVPLFDRLADRLTHRLQTLSPRLSGRSRISLLSPARNPLHVAAWLLLAVISLSSAKHGTFRPQLHAFYGTPLIVRSARGSIGCDDNPVFCRPFSFLEEVSLWMKIRAP